MIFEVTDAAFARINELLKNKNVDSGILRIAVNGGGCSGFMYNYEFTEVIEADDFVATKGVVSVVIDSVSQQFMDGCILDFISELGGAHFEIRNPNAKAKCGCGNSFAV